MPDEDNKTPPAKIEPSSAFFLGPQDRPSDFITPVRLKLNNFDDWSHAVCVALRSRSKFVFLNGTIKSPKAPATQDDWETVHCMLVSWLMNTIDPEVKSILSNYDDAKRLWDGLHERFSLVNGPRIQQLKSEITNCIQTPTMTVAVYYGKLSMLWDELDKQEPLISCTCHKCECYVATRRGSDRLHQFFLGLLHDLYGSLRSVLLSQDPLPTLNHVFQTISQEERVRESTGFTVRTLPRPPPRIIPQHSNAERKALFYSHCKKSGHDVTMCFDLLGEISDWWYELKSAKPQKKGSRGASAQVWSSHGDVGNGSNVVHVVVADAPTTSGSQSQIMLYSTPSHHLTGKWIIDTRCSHHVTGDLAALIDVCDVPSRPVHLPNGQQVHANKIGRIALTSKILLDRDLSMRTVIGMGDRLDGLYYLRPENNLVANTVDVVSSLTLWHHRLGHL
ncbi:hypothetical protein RND81_06G090100 [Saponaria officinalis]|uniref:Retrotransposon Copia-like N-terminal domain-containing protein n=1 Tax=Saponaria officinalis TaxID=3572 RepID=A0AAW1K7S3_SAPOF